MAPQALFDASKVQFTSLTAKQNEETRPPNASMYAVAFEALFAVHREEIKKHPDPESFVNDDGKFKMTQARQIYKCLRSKDEEENGEGTYKRYQQPFPVSSGDRANFNRLRRTAITKWMEENNIPKSNKRQKLEEPNAPEPTLAVEPNVPEPTLAIELENILAGRPKVQEAIPGCDAEPVFKIMADVLGDRNFTNKLENRIKEDMYEDEDEQSARGLATKRREFFISKPNNHTFFDEHFAPTVLKEAKKKNIACAMNIPCADDGDDAMDGDAMESGMDGAAMESGMDVDANIASAMNIPCADDGDDAMDGDAMESSMDGDAMESGMDVDANKQVDASTWLRNIIVNHILVQLKAMGMTDVTADNLDQLAIILTLKGNPGAQTIHIDYKGSQFVLGITNGTIPRTEAFVLDETKEADRLKIVTDIDSFIKACESHSEAYNAGRDEVWKALKNDAESYQVELLRDFGNVMVKRQYLETNCTHLDSSDIGLGDLAVFPRFCLHRGPNFHSKRFIIFGTFKFEGMEEYTGREQYDNIRLASDILFPLLANKKTVGYMGKVYILFLVKTLFCDTDPIPVDVKDSFPVGSWPKFFIDQLFVKKRDGTFELVSDQDILEIAKYPTEAPEAWLGDTPAFLSRLKVISKYGLRIKCSEGKETFPSGMKKLDEYRVCQVYAFDPFGFGSRGPLKTSPFRIYVWLPLANLWKAKASKEKEITHHTIEFHQEEALQMKDLEEIQSTLSGRESDELTIDPNLLSTQKKKTRISNKLSKILHLQLSDIKFDGSNAVVRAFTNVFDEHKGHVPEFEEEIFEAADSGGNTG